MESLDFFLSHRHCNHSGDWFRPEHREHFRLIRKEAQNYAIEFVDRFNRRFRETICFKNKSENIGFIESNHIFKDATYQLIKDSEQLVIDGVVYKRV
tara:strand:- start:258 stop:548 length:291 start_codon:yes stop_codon:yes gene_type:complete